VVDLHVILLAGLAVFAGAFVQGVVGMGFALSLPLRSRLSASRFRVAVLAVVAVSGLAALTQSLWR
jgi:hypothetical protein